MALHALTERERERERETVSYVDNDMYDALRTYQCRMFSINNVTNIEFT